MGRREFSRGMVSMQHPGIEIIAGTKFFLKLEGEDVFLVLQNSGQERSYSIPLRQGFGGGTMGIGEITEMNPIFLFVDYESTEAKTGIVMLYILIEKVKYLVKGRDEEMALFFRRKEDFAAALSSHYLEWLENVKGRHPNEVHPLCEDILRYMAINPDGLSVVAKKALVSHLTICTPCYRIYHETMNRGKN